MRIQSALLGVSCGDFHPRRHESFLAFGELFQEQSPVKGPAYCVRCNFTRTVLRARHKDQFTAIHPQFFWSRGLADAVIVQSGESAVITNADCPILALRKGRFLLVAHCGLKSLVDLDCSGRPSLIEAVAQEFGTDLDEAFIGYGIGPCCYTAPHALTLLEKAGSQAVGPGPTVNLLKLIREQMHASGIRPTNTTIEPRCTACAKAKGEYAYHSHRRGDKSRNAAVFWLG